MRLILILNLILILGVLGTGALADSGRDLIRVITQDPNARPATLIIPDPENGIVNGAILVPGKPEEIAGEDSIIDLTRGSRIGAVLNSEGRIGLSTKDGKLEVGLNGGIGVGPGFLNLGIPVAMGGYLQVAPLEGEIGRRLYLRGSIYWSYAVGVSEIAVGYRHITDEIYASKDYWFIELGTVLNDPSTYAGCGSCDLAGKLMVTFGFAFR